MFEPREQKYELGLLRKNAIKPTKMVKTEVKMAHHHGGCFDRD